MAQVFDRSLLLRLGALMATITLLALATMGVSVVIAESLKGRSAAINQAGSLRMQAYRALSQTLAAQGQIKESHRKAISLAEKEFERRMSSPRLVNALPDYPDSKLHIAYENVETLWRQECKPLLQAYLTLLEQVTEPGGGDYIVRFRNPNARASAIHLRDQTVESIGNFVEHIDQLVLLLEEDSESKLRLLRAVQVAALFSTLIVVFITMHLTETEVVSPLNELLGCAERARSGDFEWHVEHTTGDELGRLGHAFNFMAEDLSQLYREFEARVAEQTTELRRTNLSLELLYRTLAQLSQGRISDQTYRSLLAEVQAVLGAESAAICLSESDQGEAHLQATAATGTMDVRPPMCSAPLCAPCLALNQALLRDVKGPDETDIRVLTVPLGDRETSYGVMNFMLRDSTPVESWQVQLTEAVGRNVGLALVNARRAAETRRMGLIEERTAIARELHDSLAQSLSYLKIQVARLQAILEKDSPKKEVTPVVNELREGLSGAYRQLRELLTTFRIQINDRTLTQALEETIEEYRSRTTTAISLDNRLQGCVLDPNDEIHILQIVREALSNMVRHAHARTARVTLRFLNEHGVEVTIEDDGIGVKCQSVSPHHYGLAIMRERAEALGGTFSIHSPAGEGTQVTLSFPSTVRGAHTPPDHKRKRARA